MKYMQCRYLNIIGMMVLIIGVRTSSHAQNTGYRLTVADSLFEVKRYTQSFDLYQNILKQKQYTSAMLLKMAYIQEGLSNVGLAMYYLNLYFLVSNDKSVLSKMETMATKYNLQGYESTDTDKFISFYHDYHFYITIFLAALCLLMVSIMFNVKRKRQGRPIASAVFAMLFIITLFVHLNFGERITTGIIAQPNTYVMEGPSAGAPVLNIINEGHRVEVLGQRDVWTQVLWNNDVVYVKNGSVMAVEL